MTHWRFSCEKPRSSLIDGRATFTIATSSTTMNWTLQSSASASHLRRSVCELVIPRRRSGRSDLDSRASVGAQRAQPPFELGALDLVGAQRDRPLVGALGARPVAGPLEQLGVSGVEGLIAIERGILEQRLDQLEARLGAGGEAHGGDAV